MYAHLLRQVQDLEKEFPEEVEVLVFTSLFAPLLSAAMRLRAQGLGPGELWRASPPVERADRGLQRECGQSPRGAEDPEHLPRKSGATLPLDRKRPSSSGQQFRRTCAAAFGDSSQD